MIRKGPKRVPRKEPLGALGDGEARIASPAEYKRRLAVMVARQRNLCALCLAPFTEYRPPSFEHECSRSGGKRNDRTLDEQGNWRNAATHADCNALKGSKRYTWLRNNIGWFTPAR